MVQANELRIGNYVFRSIYSFCGKSLVVTKVRDIPYLIDDNKEGYLINEVWADEYEPIPLTTEILQKCEFEEFTFGFIHESGIVINFSRNTEFPGDGSQHMYVDLGNNSVEIEFLHQLQNLFFALKGEELTVNFSTP